MLVVASSGSWPGPCFAENIHQWHKCNLYIRQCYDYFSFKFSKDKSKYELKVMPSRANTRQSAHLDTAIQIYLGIGRLNMDRYDYLRYLSAKWIGNFCKKVDTVSKGASIKIIYRDFVQTFSLSLYYQSLSLGFDPPKKFIFPFFLNWWATQVCLWYL